MTVVDRRRPLAEVAWAHRTPGLRALGFHFGVRTTDPALGRYLERLFQPFAVREQTDSMYSFVVRTGGIETFTVYFEDEEVITTSGGAAAFQALLWHINRRVVDETSDHLLIHAAAAEHEGRTILFPASTESGKTTLVASLIQAGLRYVTDEIVAIEPTSSEVIPYPKALSVHPGSWSVLQDLKPSIDPTLERYTSGEWQVEPRTIRAGAIAPRSLPGLVVFPRLDRSGRTELHPVGRAEALFGLTANCFNLWRFGEPGLKALAAAIGDCRFYRLALGDLERATDLILGLVRRLRLD